MPKVVLLVLDSFGIGGSYEAWRYQDEGANTFYNAALYYQQQFKQPLKIDNLLALGLGQALTNSIGNNIFANKVIKPIGLYGSANIKSYGKDTTTGHWELAGILRPKPLGTFERTMDSFPKELLAEICHLAKLPGTLGNKHCDGLQVILDHGAEHLATGKPIFYTSTDSVLQIAAHIDSFGLNRLYDLCNIVRRCVDRYDIGRVIARPFTGEVGNFQRIAARKDFGMPPPDCLLSRLAKHEVPVISVGKIWDIFAGVGITQHYHGKNDAENLAMTLDALTKLTNDGLVLVNLADFDALYGHRRDPIGYMRALEEFDRYLPTILAKLQADDYLVITGDHGCDPTFPGFHHTKEQVPILIAGPNIASQNIGIRATIADIGQTIAKSFTIPALSLGTTIF